MAVRMAVSVRGMATLDMGSMPRWLSAVVGEKFREVRALPVTGVASRGVAELPRIVTPLKNRLHGDDDRRRWTKKPMKWRC